MSKISEYSRDAFMSIAKVVTSTDLHYFGYITEVKSAINLLRSKGLEADRATSRGTYEDMLSKLTGWLATTYEALDGDLADISTSMSMSPFHLLTENAKVGAPAWSVLPVVTCGGAGTCKSYCYSLKAWRNPAAVGRQIQNTIIARLATTCSRYRVAFMQIMEDEIKKWGRKRHARKHIRLHVDGDMWTVEYLKMWAEIVASCPDSMVYTYTKAFEVWSEYDRLYGSITLPENLRVRLSTDHRYGNADVVRLVEHMHTTVGYFHTYTHANARDARVCGYMAECEGGCKACNYKCASRIGDIWVEIH